MECPFNGLTRCILLCIAYTYIVLVCSCRGTPSKYEGRSEALASLLWNLDAWYCWDAWWIISGSNCKHMVESARAPFLSRNNRERILTWIQFSEFYAHPKVQVVQWLKGSYNQNALLYQHADTKCSFQTFWLKTNFRTVSHYAVFSTLLIVQVQIYSSVNGHVKKTISKFKESAYCGTFRDDGQLLVVGDGNGSVKVMGALFWEAQWNSAILLQVFELGGRSLLRQFKGHTRYVTLRVLACMCWSV